MILIHFISFFVVVVSKNMLSREYLLHLYLAEINLSPYASWNQTGVNVAGWSNGTAGSSISQLNYPFSISISNNDVLYVSDFFNHRIVVVDLNLNTNLSTIGPGPGNSSTQFYNPDGIFVTNTSLYVIDYNNHRVQKTFLNNFNFTTVLKLSGFSWPRYLYVNKKDDIYLSDTVGHRVLLFLSNSTNFTVVAGNGTPGSSNSQLNKPCGVFINENDILYIADWGNNRIMKWLSGASYGFIVAGNGIGGTSTTQLNGPTQVIVDMNGYMYITESLSARITRWAPNATVGVCIGACSGTSGIAPHQLNYPGSLAFDSHGSLYISDWFNNRIQKFQIIQYQSKY